MSFEIGQDIKVQDSSKWICGTFLDEMPCNKSMVKVRGKEQIWETNKIRKHIKLKRNPDGSRPQLDEFESKYWQHLKNTVSIGLNHIFGDKAPSLEINDEEHIISIGEGWISIAAGVTEDASISGFIEKPTWCVSVAVPTSGSYWEPPDVDIIEIGDCQNTIGAAELFVTTIWKEKNRSFWDDLDMSRYIEEDL
jgi:hypothetical protein